MKKLILIRHAKSSWEYDIPDHTRSLSKRGLRDADMISHNLKSQINPDLIVSSEAVRAKTTAEIFIKNLNFDLEKFNLNDELYDFYGESLIRVIKNSNDTITELMIFGHNNAITNFVNSFGDTIIDNVPTCGVTIIIFEINSWKELKKGRTIKTLFPRDLKF
ncbi:histidine phosphatase family protein [Gaetbulibacter aquiaggeris]|uniref:Histidine phosphatase family protein n=1 Tax=Gaetbulibacter aquiaggeris TaxID=1735373 RepID=A0ABW7MRE9_9FLAO